jgi:hypothetical protein
VSILRRTLGDSVGQVTVTAPTAPSLELALIEAPRANGARNWDAPESGLYRLREGDLDSGRRPWPTGAARI